MASKAGVVALIGQPNAGKSTLLNRLIGVNLASVTPKPQTTRFLITGLLHHEEGQILFIDTPGVITHPKNAWHEALNRHGRRAAEEADVIVYLTSALWQIEAPSLYRPPWLENIHHPLLIAVTHADRVSPATRKTHIASIVTSFAPWKPSKVYDVSLDQPLEPFVKDLLTMLPEGPPLYSPDEITPQPLRFFVAEILRKHLYLHLQDELPYSTEVEVTNYRETPERDYISAVIYVEKPSHKPMIIGRKGAMIKKIRIEMRREIENLLGKPTHIELYVKLMPNWRKSATFLKKLNYSVNHTKVL
jgi:GTP-binding protein Era